MPDKTIVIKYKADTGEYTMSVQDAAGATDDLAVATRDVNTEAMRAADVWREAQDQIGDVASSVAALRGGMEDLGIATAKQLEQFKKIEGVADIMEGVSRPFSNVAVMYTLLADNAKHYAFAIGAVASATWALGATMAAITSRSEEERAAFSALAGVTWALTGAQIALAIAKQLQIPVAGIALAVAAAATAGALIGGVGTYVAAGQASVKGAQYGMHETVTKPTIILVGERGPERVDITPQDSSTSSGERPQVNVNVMIDGRDATLNAMIEENYRGF